MSSNVEGFKYEKEVISTLIESGLAGNITEGAGASSADADADIYINGEYHLVEVKKDLYAQMGGTSVRYSGDSFEPVGKAVEGDTFEIVSAALETKKEDLQRLLDFLGQDGFPFTCTKDAWETAKIAGLLKPINTKVKKDTTFLAEHYAQKGVNYIQIGGAGLFHLGNNPAGLPVPELVGEIDIELRAGRSGSKPSATGEPVVGGSLRAQGRLKFQGLSPYTLDDPDSVSAMIKEMKGE